MHVRSPPEYVLGSTDAEHARLIRQAALLAPGTERLFQAAGIGPGDAVLDVGCGVGDVSMLAARLVGPTGMVVGIDRDAAALGKARQRAAASGLAHITFMEADLDEIPLETPFDAAVGRLILQFLPDPAVVLRGLAARVRPGGAVAFQDASWDLLASQLKDLTLRAACAERVMLALLRGGARTDMGTRLHALYQAIGLPAPRLMVDLPIGHDAEIRSWLHDLFTTLGPACERFGISLSALGDLRTLRERLDAELDAAGAHAACIGLIGAIAYVPIPDRSAP